VIILTVFDFTGIAERDIFEDCYMRRKTQKEKNFLIFESQKDAERDFFMKNGFLKIHF